MKKLIIGLCVALCGLALTANATAYTESNLTSGDNTLTLTEDSTLTVGSDISIGKLTVAGNGYTLTLAGSAAVTASSLEIDAGATVQLASGTTLANGALQSSTVTGAGVIGYTAVAPDALESWADEDNWTGTVWVQGLSQNAWNPTGLGNANSTLRLSGFTGYFAQAYITVPFAVELENSTYSSAMNVNNGFSYNPSGKAYFATPTLKGSGTYTANTSGGSLFIVTDDWSGFIGTFALSGKTVWLGYAAPGTNPGWAPGDQDVANGTVSGGIRIAAGKSVDWNTGWTLTKFLGEGTIKMANPWEATATFAGYVSDSTLWTGTVELAAHEATGSTSIWPARMGNANSKVVLKGLTSNGGSHWFGDTSAVTAIVQLDGACTIDNGASGSTYEIAKLTGEGSFTAAFANVSSANIKFSINTVTNYTGTLSALTGAYGKNLIAVRNFELPAIPAADTLLFNVDENNSNVTLENIKIGDGVIAASSAAEMKSGADGYGWYWTAASAPVTDGDGNPYLTIMEAINAGKTDIYVNLDIEEACLTINRKWINLHLADGVTVTCDEVDGHYGNSKLYVKLQDGATTATFKVPVGAQMPQLQGFWYDAGVTFHVYGDYNLGDTLFTYGKSDDKFGSVDNTHSASIGQITTDKGIVRFSKLVDTDVVTAANQDYNFNAIVAGRKYYWVGGDAGVWNAAANWQYADGTAAGEYPQNQAHTYDGDHVIVTNVTAISIPNKATINRFTADADVTLSSTTITGNTGLWFDLMNGDGQVTFNGLYIAIISSNTRHITISNDVCIATGSSNVFQTGKDRTSSFYGDLSGDGTLTLWTNGNYGGLALYGDNGEFSGTLDTSASGSTRNNTSLYYGNASSPNAYWKVRANSYDVQTQSIIRDSGIYYFGALDGYVSVGDFAPTLVIGNRSDVDSAFTITSRKDTKIVKVGSGTATQSLSGATGNGTYNTIYSYDIQGGMMVLNAILPTTSLSFSGDGGILMTPSYEVTVEEVASQYYPDPSALVKNSTATIAFDTGAEDFTWATSLAASNTGGLTKKGSGTLTLSAAPLCSGPLVVAEGKLVMPPSGANFKNLALGTGATLELDLSGVTADGVLFSAPAAAGTTLTAENVVIKNAASDCSVVINATGSSVAVVKGTGATYTWVGGAKKTVNDEEVDDPAWETAANWQVGGEAASVAPGGLDSVVFNTAEPGFTLAAAVSVMDMTVNAQGFAFAADFALSVLGDMTVSTPGALAISGTGSLDVNGVASGITSVAMTPTTATSTIINAHPYYTERFTVGADLALTSLDGAGTISSDADQTVTIAENATSTFYGSFTGDMSLTKSGKGTLTLQGPSDFTGDLFISEGTLALSAYDYTSYVKFDFDAMNTNNWTTTESDGRIYVTRLKTRTGGCSSGQLSYSYFQDISSGAAYPELVEDSDYFGGKPCVKVSDGVQMAYQDSKSVRARANGWMFVYQKNDTPSANKNLLTGGNSSGKDYLTLQPSGSWYAHRYQSDISDYLYSDGENDATFTAGKKSVISIPYSVAENDNRYEILDGAFNGVVAQMIGFSPAPPLEVRAAIETYLMQKWGCDAAIDNQYLPKTARVTMAAGATLDLGGMTQTVKSFTGAGTVQNGTLKTADNTVTVTGDLTIPVTDNTTYVIPADVGEIRLRLTGTAMNVSVNASAITKPLHIYYEGDLTLSVPKRWENYTHANGVYHIGSNPFVIRLR